MKEKDFNLKSSLYMAERLKQLGIPVALTRDSDITLSRTERIDNALNAFGKNKDVILVSNHINAGGGEGAEIVYALRNNNTLARLALENIGQEGQIMRKYYQRRLPENPMQDYYYIIRDTAPLESILVEYGFIDNANDLKKLQNNLLDYTEAVVRAIATYTNTPYTPPSGSSGEYYTVKAGDSLWSIANQFNTTAASIRELNNLTSDSLKIGQMLKIPSSTSGGNTPSGETYTVKSGDSLWSIANRFNITVANLREWNKLTSDNLTIGQVLNVSKPDSGETPTPTGETYTVKAGDSLWSIANRFNTSADNLRKWNNLTNDTLKIGQVLHVSEPTSDGIIPPSGNYEIYTVKSGDSLWSIATKYNTTVNDIISLNGLTSNVLTVGQQLKIPGTVGTPTPPTSEREYDTYVVVSGDSLWLIANRYGTSVDELVSLNDLTSTNLKVGQQLKVPRTNSNNTYVVERGDSLWSIAKKFDIPVDKLKELNGLTTNTVQIGQVLVVS